MQLQVKLNTNKIIKALIHVFTCWFIITLFVLWYKTNPFYIANFSSQVLNLVDPISYILIVISAIHAAIVFVLAKDFPNTDALHIFNYLLNALKQLKLVALNNLEKKAFLYLLLKGFFLPIMLAVVVSNFTNLQQTVTLLQNGGNLIFNDFYHAAINVLFLIDTLIFSFGYLFATKYLKNEIKSVETSWLGWLSALIVYPPFNAITGQAFPLAKLPFAIDGLNPNLIIGLQIIVLGCVTGFVLCSLNLGFKASNLTSRGVVGWGLYGIIRHPAYVFKLSGWFVEGLIWAGSIQYFLALIIYIVIYHTRAVTEEKHMLRSDPEYATYMQRVKYRYVPGVI